jgi:hypothetical protein
MRSKESMHLDWRRTLEAVELKQMEQAEEIKRLRTYVLVLEGERAGDVRRLEEQEDAARRNQARMAEMGEAAKETHALLDSHKAMEEGLRVEIRRAQARATEEAADNTEAQRRLSTSLLLLEQERTKTGACGREIEKRDGSLERQREKIDELEGRHAEEMRRARNDMDRLNTENRGRCDKLMADVEQAREVATSLRAELFEREELLILLDRRLDDIGHQAAGAGDGGGGGGGGVGAGAGAGLEVGAGARKPRSTGRGRGGGAGAGAGARARESKWEESRNAASPGFSPLDPFFSGYSGYAPTRATLSVYDERAGL